MFTATLNNAAALAFFQAKLVVWVGALAPGLFTFALGVFCYTQSKRGEGVLRRNTWYNMLMLSASMLLFLFGLLLSLGVLVFLSRM